MNRELEGLFTIPCLLLRELLKLQAFAKKDRSFNGIRTFLRTCHFKLIELPLNFEAFLLYIFYMYRVFQKTVFSHCNGGGRTSFIISPRLSPTNLRRFRAYLIDLYVFVVLEITTV